MLSTVEEDVQTTSAQNSRLGVELAVTLQPDLILLELQMPDLDGFDALSVFGEKLPATSVVIVSGSLEPKDMEKAISMGAMGFIPKTASSDIMRHALTLIMSGVGNFQKNMLIFTFAGNFHHTRVGIANGVGHQVANNPAEQRGVGIKTYRRRLHDKAQSFAGGFRLKFILDRSENIGQGNMCFFHGQGPGIQFGNIQQRIEHQCLQRLVQVMAGRREKLGFSDIRVFRFFLFSGQLKTQR